MEITIYHYALCVSLTLMIFFSYRFLFGRLPQKESYRPYRQSRMMMGAALLLLSANYMIHFFVTPRLTSPQLAIVINLCTYWGAVMLFGSALMMLLERSRITRKRIVCHAMAWAGYCVVAWMMWAIVPEGMFRRLMLFLLAAMFLVYASGVAGRVFHTFRKARRKLDDYYSEDSEAYIRWMSVFTYWAVVFGVAQGIFTFLPNRYVFIWIISAIPFLYLSVCVVCQLLPILRKSGRGIDHSRLFCKTWRNQHVPHPARFSRLLRKGGMQQGCRSSGHIATAGGDA